MSEMTHTEFLATMTERFGAIPKDWSFTCPSCGTVQTGRDWQALVGDDWTKHVGQDCLGRHADSDRGCDWCSYGLFRGPLHVTDLPGGGGTWCFPITEVTR